MSARPPRVARFLLLRLLPPHARETVIGDLDEEFCCHHQSAGRSRAWTWYWGQTVRSVLAARTRDGREGTSQRSRIMGQFADDLRSGTRLLRTQPGFSTVAVLTLAVGIGLSTALFTVIHAAVLRPLPFPNPEELVIVDVTAYRQGESQTTAPSLADVRDWRAVPGLFAAIAVEADKTPMVVDAGEPSRLTVRPVSEDYFEIFGIAPVVGRSLSRTDVGQNAPSVVMLGHAYWQSQFGGDAAALGGTIRIDNEPATIIGVVPAGFHPDVEVWRPLRYTAATERRRGTGAGVVARLASGRTLASVAQDLSALATRADTASGASDRTDAVLKSVLESTTAGKASTVYTLTGAVAAILLIACVNVAGLLLARGSTRRGELAVRAALGAGRARLIRQLVTESLVLALAGGAAGIGLAWLTLDGLLAIVPLTVPGTATASLNVQVLAFAGLASVVTVMIFGVWPAVRLSRVEVGSALQGAERHSAATLSRRSGHALIAVEVALALVLLAGAGVMVKSFARLVSADLGFDPTSFITMEVTPVDPDPAVGASFYPALVEAIRTLPGVAAVGASNQLPIGGSRRAGRVTKPDGTLMRVDHRLVLPGYFEAVGMSLVEGRLPTEADRRSGRPVMVINESTAKQVFPGASAAGQILEMPADKLHAEVIGVVRDVRQEGARSPARPNVYAIFTGRELRPPPLAIFVRPAPGAGDLAGRLPELAQSRGPAVVVDRIRSGGDFVADSVTVPRHRMLLLSLLGSVGLGLTLVGVFGVTAYAVVRRTREIGVRMALGAEPSAAMAAVMREAAWPLGLGLVAGLSGAYALTRVIAGFLFETTPQDPVAFAGATVLLTVCVLIATWLPARRASRIDPVVALRGE